MALDRTRTLRGALAGAAAAAVWAAQQPLDQRVFGVDYDDVELLGRFVHRRGRAAYPVGLAMHIANGAVFGAVYANAAPRAAGPGRAARAAGRAGRAPRDLAGHGRARALHPAAGDLPELWGSRARSRRRPGATCCSATVLGELERRLNPPDSEPRPIDPAAAASNGHGSAEYVVSLN